MRSAHDAYLALQKALPSIEKDASAPKYQYASLPALLGAVLPVLWEAGFAIRWEGFRPGPGEHGERAVLTHVETGTAFVSEVACPTQYQAPGNPTPPQLVGMASTYARRYALLGVLGVCAGYEADDDCRPAEPAEPKTGAAWADVTPPAGASVEWFTAQARSMAAAELVVTKDQKRRLHAAAKGRGFEWDASKSRYVVGRSPDAPADMAF